jgi:hypothetical protein
MIVQSHVVVCPCKAESICTARGEQMSPTVVLLIGLGIGLLLVVVVILAMVLYIRLRPTQTYHHHSLTPNIPDRDIMTYIHEPGQFPPNSPR